MRVTSGTTYSTLASGLGSALARVQSLQDSLASGRRINRLSDAPADVVSALRLRAEEEDWSAWQRASNDASTRLSVADGALQSASSILRKVGELTASAVNGALSPEAREALAQEVEQLRDQLLDAANTKHLGGAVFGGFSATAVSSSGGTWAFSGDQGELLRQVGNGVTVTANVDGKAAFGFAGSGPDAFTLIDTIAADIRADSTAGLSADVTALTARQSDVSTALGVVGARVNRVETVADQGKAIVGQLKVARSDLEDVDIEAAILDLSQAQTAYQAALGAAARANLPSLADFLR